MTYEIRTELMHEEHNEKLLDDASIIHRYSLEMAQEKLCGSYGDGDAEWDDPKFQGFVSVQIAAALEVIIKELAALRWTIANNE